MRKPVTSTSSPKLEALNTLPEIQAFYLHSILSNWKNMEELRSFLKDVPFSIYIKERNGCYLFIEGQLLEAMFSLQSKDLEGKSDVWIHRAVKAPLEMAINLRANDRWVMKYMNSLSKIEQVPCLDGGNATMAVASTKIPLFCNKKVVGTAGISFSCTKFREVQLATECLQAFRN